MNNKKYAKLTKELLLCAILILIIFSGLSYLANNIFVAKWNLIGAGIIVLLNIVLLAIIFFLNYNEFFEKINTYPT